MKRNIATILSQVFLRISLAITMLSAVADRFGIWPKNNSVWYEFNVFERYTRKLTFFLPETLSTFSAYAATGLEIIFSLMLILGIKLKLASYGTCGLLFIFALSMTIALNPKAPLDYSVWVGSAAACLLAQQKKYYLVLIP